MIFMVQVFPYQTNNGCSVRVGHGYDLTETLNIRDGRRLQVSEFVETEEEVKLMIRHIQKLPKHYRGKEKAIEKLQSYVRTSRYNGS